MTYDELFFRALHRTPFPYQRALALADELPEALSAPTGAGKTAAIALGWLPWASLVQRAGRCNRLGEDDNAAVVWSDHASEKVAPPYEPGELAWRARISRG